MSHIDNVWINKFGVISTCFHSHQGSTLLEGTKIVYKFGVLALKDFSASVDKSVWLLIFRTVYIAQVTTSSVFWGWSALLINWLFPGLSSLGVAGYGV
jgi:hypothetical protein